MQAEYLQDSKNEVTSVRNKLHRLKISDKLDCDEPKSQGHGSGVGVTLSSTHDRIENIIDF